MCIRIQILQSIGKTQTGEKSDSIWMQTKCILFALHWYLFPNCFAFSDVRMSPRRDRKGSESEIRDQQSFTCHKAFRCLSCVGIFKEWRKEIFICYSHSPPQKNTNNITPKCPVQVKHYFIKITAFWGYILVPSSHTISPRVFVCVSPNSF